MRATQPDGGGRGGRKLFELLVAQLSDPDVQARCAGATTRFNGQQRYGEALGNLSEQIGAIVSEMDSRTTLVVLAEHVLG